MTEAEARDWLRARFSAASVDRVETYVSLLLAETQHQNLIAASTIPSLWARHVVDSAQLLDHAGDAWTHWVDVGAGAGLPGLVVAALTDRKVTLIEPRKLRAAFLERCADILGGDITVIAAKAERVADIRAADIVSARAVANLNALLAASQGFTTRRTIFVLPKGEVAQSEVAAARKTWQGRFHVEQSIVDPNSGIVVATQVAPK